MREFESFEEFGFGQFLGRAFNHDHIVFSADVNKVQIALGALVVCRIGHELAIDPPDAHRADRARKRNIRNAQRSRGAVERENIGIVLPIGAEQDRDDLGVVKISLRKKRPERAIYHSRSERFLFCRAAFALEIATRKFAGGCGFLAIINCKREVVLTFFDYRGRNGASKHGGVPAGDDNGAIGEPGNLAGFNRYFIAADFGGDLLLHGNFPGYAVPGGHPDCRF